MKRAYTRDRTQHYTMDHSQVLNFSYLQAHTSKHRPIISSTYDVHLLTAKSCTQVNARHICAVTTVAPQDESNPTLKLMGIEPMTTDLTVTPLTN